MTVKCVLFFQAEDGIRDIGVTGVQTCALPILCTHGIARTAPKARIADSPGLRIGVPVSTPKTPTLVIVIVPPDMSAGLVLPARAVSVRSDSARASSASDSRPASLMLGTTRPRGVAAAMPRLT